MPQRGQRSPRAIRQLGAQDQDRALVRALVIDALDGDGAGRLALGWKCLVQLDRLLAVDDAGEVDAAARQERKGRGDHCAEGGRRLQPVLEHERQLALVERIGPEADPQGIEHRALVVPGIALRLGLQRQHVRVGDRHGRVLLAFLPQCDQSPQPRKGPALRGGAASGRSRIRPFSAAARPSARRSPWSPCLPPPPRSPATSCSTTSPSCSRRRCTATSAWTSRRTATASPRPAT